MPIVISQYQSKDIKIPASLRREEITLERGASADIDIGNSNHAELDIRLIGEYASMRVFGAFRGKDEEEQDIVLRIFQDAPNTTANVVFRAALWGRAMSRFDALIRIGENAKGARGKLSYRALLLSEGARAKPIPRLEILTKEVASAGHEATVGKIDPAQLFYMQSRGLSREEAERLVVEGFLDIATKYEMVRKGFPHPLPPPQRGGGLGKGFS